MILKAVIPGMFDSNCYILVDEGEAAVIDPGADVEDIARILDEQGSKQGLNNGLKLKYIIMTHAHIDHIAQVDNLRYALGGKTVVHKDDAPLLGDARLNGSVLFMRSRTFEMADVLVSDGDVLELGKAKLEIIHTPGHTPGGMCILVTCDADDKSSMSDSCNIGWQEEEEGGNIVSQEDEEGGGSGESCMSVSRNIGSQDDEEGGSSGESCIFTGDTLFRMSIGRTDLGAGDQHKLMESVRRLMELDGTLKVYPGHGPSTTIDFERENNPWL